MFVVESGVAVYIFAVFMDRYICDQMDVKWIWSGFEKLVKDICIIIERLVFDREVMDVGLLKNCVYLIYFYKVYLINLQGQRYAVYT